jgi:hypothetical protein
MTRTTNGDFANFYFCHMKFPSELRLLVWERFYMNLPRVMPDGTLVFPHRGKPPEIPDGYIKGKDMWTLIPVWHQCPFREYFVFKSEECNCQRAGFRCGHPSNFVNNIRPFSTVEYCGVCTYGNTTKSIS